MITGGEEKIKHMHWLMHCSVDSFANGLRMRFLWIIVPSYSLLSIVFSVTFILVNLSVHIINFQYANKKKSLEQSPTLYTLNIRQRISKTM